MLSLLWPTPARLPLGGRFVAVAPFRLRDIARLEQWAAARAGTASQGLWAALQIPDAPARHDELRRLYRAQERGAVSFGSADVQGWLATLDGQAEQLRLSTRTRDRHTGRIRHLPFEVCRDMAADADDEEWFSWATIANQAHPLDELARAIDAEIGADWPAASRLTKDDRTPGDGWAEAAWAVAKATGWSFRQIGNLTLAQWDVARADGRSRENCHAVPGSLADGIDPREFQANVGVKREAFWEAEARP